MHRLWAWILVGSSVLIVSVLDFLCMPLGLLFEAGLLTTLIPAFAPPEEIAASNVAASYGRPAPPVRHHDLGFVVDSAARRPPRTRSGCPVAGLPARPVDTTYWPFFAD